MLPIGVFAKSSNMRSNLKNKESCEKKKIQVTVVSVFNSYVCGVDRPVQYMEVRGQLKSVLYFYYVCPGD